MSHLETTSTYIYHRWSMYANIVNNLEYPPLGLLGINHKQGEQVSQSITRACQLAVQSLLLSITGVRPLFVATEAAMSFAF